MHRLILTLLFLVFATGCDRTAELVNEIKIRRQLGKQIEQKLKNITKALESGEKIPLPQEDSSRANLAPEQTLIRFSYSL